MPSLIHPTTIRFPVILAYYFINAVVWISDFKPLHLEGDVDVHKYYCTWNSITWKFCNPSYIICTFNFWEFVRNMTPGFSPRTYFGGQSTFTQPLVWAPPSSLSPKSWATQVAQLARLPRVDIWDLYPLSRQSVRRLSSTFSGIKAESKGRETTRHHA